MITAEVPDYGKPVEIDIIAMSSPWVMTVTENHRPGYRPMIGDSRISDIDRHHRNAVGDMAVTQHNGQICSWLRRASSNDDPSLGSHEHVPPHVEEKVQSPFEHATLELSGEVSPHGHR